MKKIWFLLILLIVLPLNSNGQFFKKLGKALEKADKWASTPTSPTNNDTNTEEVSGVVEETQDGVKIASCHPDIKVKIKRCEASNKTCIVDLIITNVNDNDISEFGFAGGTLRGGYFPPISVAYDDEGNQITNNNFLTGVAGKPVETGGSFTALPSNVPVKLRIQLEGIPESATKLTRIDLSCICGQINVKLDKPIILKNVPITRDGDE